MDAESDFLRQIHANPRCVATKLVFADWLEEHPNTVTCPTCKPWKRAKNWVPGHVPSPYSTPYWQVCRKCDGTAEITGGQAARAAFIRDCPPLKHSYVSYGRWAWTYDRFRDGKFFAAGMPCKFHPEAMKVMPPGLKSRLTAYTVRHGFANTIEITPGLWEDSKLRTRLRKELALTAVVLSSVPEIVRVQTSPFLLFRLRRISKSYPIPHEVSGYREIALYIYRQWWPELEFSYAAGVS